MRPQCLRSSAGYLVLLVSILVSVVTIGYLGQAAEAAEGQRKVQQDQTRISALYAAESALLMTESLIVENPQNIPPSGTWRAVRLTSSQASARAEILHSPETPNALSILVRSRARQGNDGTQVIIRSSWQKDQNTWRCVGRSLLTNEIDRT